jgi:tetratricopeptide (TPR) repeat protein
VLSQKVTTKVTVYSEIFLTDTGLIPLPENAVELEPEFAIKSEFFKSPLKLAQDPEGNLYVTSSESNALCRFDARGRFSGQLGEKGEGISILKGPGEVIVVDNQIVVHERVHERLRYMDLRGIQLGSRKISDIEDFEIGQEGWLFTAPRVENKDSPLIRAYLSNGMKRAFGKPIVFLHSMPSLNSRSLAVNQKGDIYAAFVYFPIVRRYSPEGALLAEYRVETPVMEAKEKYNLKIIGEGITDVSQRAGYKPLIIDIKTPRDRIYLLSHNPRLEIMELDGDGHLKTTYWMDTRELYITNDFSVRNAEGDKRFYIAHSSPPDYTVDVLKIKDRAPAGLEGDIQRWTAEIEAFPENSLAYINRGVAHHQLGDYSEALKDFSKAIELAPSSALAHNNRGLSRIKTNDFDGAINDFSKAIELDPIVAAIYFNRGIAYIHKNDFNKAIEDFTMSAKLDQAFEIRAQAQIGYCRTRLQKK